MKKIFGMIMAALVALPALAQGPADAETAERIMRGLLPYREAPTETLMTLAAVELLGTPYVAGTLEEGDTEQVRVFLTKTDCILYVETCMNLALTVKRYGEAADYQKLCDLVRQSRYRDGVAETYADRIHYTTEWIRQGEARGILRDITLAVGGEVYDHPISYMSAHARSYKHLKDAATDPRAAADLEKIAAVERALNQEPYTYIPEDRIRSIEDRIQTGDIIGFMSTTDGLDIAHVVMAFVSEGKVGFIHASFGAKEVIVDPKSIADYALSSKGIDGIKVIRVL